MEHKKYSVRGLFSNTDINQIIIPEIQRDYVWGEREVKYLLNSIYDNYLEFKKIKDINIPDVDIEISKQLIDIKKKQKSTNIGFIYAYYDKQYYNKYFLIDGQQRLTTMYLILLALSVKSSNSKIQEFKARYFKNSLLKVDYKVREDAHVFLYNFIEYIIDKKELNQLSNQYWYFSKYENDTTIASISGNYYYIKEYIDSIDVDYIEFIHYVEDYVNFWYFDTNKSKQGEELYIYMNSRGENVQESENIKALLLGKFGDGEIKNTWGKKWENWQDFFWKNKEDNNNSDKGFNSFLNWLQLIEIIKEPDNVYNKDTKLKELEANLHIVIDLETIEQYIVSLRVLFNDFIEQNDDIQKEYKDYGDIKSPSELVKNEWLTGSDNTDDKISLFPILIYIKEYCIEKKENSWKAKNDIDWLSLYRFIRFFYNISQKLSVRKRPYDAYRQLTIYANLFVKAEKKDITEMLDVLLQTTSRYQLTLSDEEIFKLKIYKKHPNDRKKIEQLFWEAENDSYFEGRTSFIFKCLNIEMKDENVSNVNSQIDKFSSYLTIFKTLFKETDDLLRRSILTKGDYLLWDGRSPSLDSDRYTFIPSSKLSWREFIFDNIHKSKYLIDLLNDIYENYNEPIDKNSVLNSIIDKYITNPDENDKWRIPFVKYTEILNYCQNKNCCFAEYGDDIFLLRRTKATTFEALDNFIELRKLT